MKTVLIISVLILSTFLTNAQTKEDYEQNLTILKLELVRSTSQAEKDILLPRIKELENKIKTINLNVEYNKILNNFNAKTDSLYSIKKISSPYDFFMEYVNTFDEQRKGMSKEEQNILAKKIIKEQLEKYK